ncbi:HAD-superfamily hydrolase, subfamily IA, variant 1 [metagenome]|uniref:HAD-superfamily hydrolase, subfamily IA, variant 1 n=1 Tax=metagenome TaxID=256318 RepID=A0A2P2BW08_9ZZZZ
MIKGVVFDLDGTLFDHHGAALCGLRAWAPTLGPTSLAPDEVEAVWFALEDRHYQGYLDGRLSHRGQRRVRMAEFSQALGLPVPDDLDEAYTGYLAAYVAAWCAYDDALPALLAVRRAGRQVAVLTNGDQDQQEAKLRSIGLSDVCGPVFASSRLGVTKPDPRAFAHVAAALDLSPGELLMVGDNLDVDVRGARDAGLRAVHVDRPTTTLADLSQMYT